MSPTSFFELFKALNPAEKTLFEQYAKTFYVRKQAELTVFDGLKQHLKVQNCEDDKQLYLLLYQREPESVKAHKNFQNELSELKKWLLEFLVWQQLRQQPDDPGVQMLRLNALQQRGLKEVHEQQRTRLTKKLNEKPEQTMWEFLAKMQLAHYEYFQAPGDTWKEKGPTMEKLLNSLDHFYGAASIKYACEAISRRAILQGVSLNHSDLLIFVDRPAFTNAAPIKLYRQIYTMLANKDESVYQTLKTKWLTLPSLPKTEKNALLMYLINYVLQSVNAGKAEESIREGLKLYQYGIDEGLFMVYDFFPPEVFDNIVTIACALQEFDWVEGFVKENILKLEATEQKDTEALSASKIAFAKKDFSTVIGHLSKIEQIKNVQQSLQARLFLIRAFFELKERSKLIEDNCDQLYFLVSRNKVINDQYQQHALNFQTMMRHLLRKKPLPKQTLKQELNALPSVFCKPWLHEKIELLPS